MFIDVIIIGAGAAGMMCAAEAARRGRRVLVLDHSKKLAERIRISGGGRCNFTNRDVGPEHYLSQNPHFCRSALAQFSQWDFIAMVEQHGIAYHEREHGQLFCDDSSQDIIDMLKGRADQAGVQWARPCAVHQVVALDGDEQQARFSLVTDNGELRCESLVVATGGLAIPKMGASPFGYRLAEQLGLGVVAPKPALVPLALGPELLTSLKPLSGSTLDASVSCVTGPRVVVPRFRENVLLTHRGLSGPAILQVSNYWQLQQYQGKPQPVVIDLLPGVDAGEWLVSQRGSRMRVDNLLATHLPKRFAHEWCQLFGWEKALVDCSNVDLEAIARALNGWELMPSGTLGYAKAEVTLGGVDTNGLSSKTMEARSVPGLYFIGEVVDVTGWLGGYNFQWAWSSGWVAGQWA